jgi:hypothetical protein
MLFILVFFLPPPPPIPLLLRLLLAYLATFASSEPGEADKVLRQGAGVVCADDAEQPVMYY